MAVNRYDQPAQADFINTYVPIPFDQMMKVGMLKQSMVEQNDKVLDETLGALNNIKVSPADEPYLAEKVSKIKNEISDIYNTAAPGSYEGKRRLMNLRNQLATDPELRDMIQNYSVYSDALTQMQEADKDNITANTMDLRELVTNLSSGGKGTLGRRKETGASGVYNKGTWSKYVDINKAMEERVNDVEDSIMANVGIVSKDGNKYIIEETAGGKGLDALGAPLGIKFRRNEKGEQIIDLSNSNIEIFLATPAGRQIQSIARENIAKGTATDFGKEVQKLYYEHALAAINERVSSKSTVKMSGDPFDEMRYKNELEDKEKNPWTTPISIATSGSKLTSMEKVKEAAYTIENQIEEANQSLHDFEQARGIQDVVYTTPDGQTSTRRVDKNGVDVSEEYDLKKAIIQQYQDQKDAIDNRVNRIKDRLKIPKTWAPNEKVLKEAEEARAGAEFNFLSKVGPDPKNNEIAKGYGQAAYERYIEKNDPTAASLNRELKKEAAKSSVITGVTKFGSKDMNERALKEFPLLMENEVQDVGTKKTLSVEDKEKLGILSANRTTTDPSRITYQGNLVDPESQKLKFVYQVYNAKGELSDPIMVDAPEGVEDSLIKEGATDKVKVVIHQQLTRLDRNPDLNATIDLGTGNDTKAAVRKSDDGSYIMTVKLTNDNGTVRLTEKIFDNRTALIDYYSSYVRESVKGVKK